MWDIIGCSDGSSNFFTCIDWRFLSEGKGIMYGYYLRRGYHTYVYLKNHVNTSQKKKKKDFVNCTENSYSWKDHCC